MTQIRRVLAAAIAVTLTVGAVSAQTSGRGPARSFLWKVESKTGVLYLAGSVHALTADVYPLNPAFERAFQAADTLVEEIDMSQGDLTTLGPMLLAKGTFQDGRTFQSAVSPETAALVASRLPPPLTSDLIRPMKPWMVMLMLTALQVQQAGLDANLGLDKYFFDKATEAGKTIIGLETAESQIDRFDQMPAPLQEQMLLSTLAELESQTRDLATIVSAWQSGDAAAMEKTMLGALAEYPAAYESLIVERNHNWLPQLEACLTRPRPCLAVVGAAHLVGPDGLLALLAQKGYTIEQQ